VDATLDALVGWADELRYSDLPADVAQKATEIVVDTLGCAIAGRDSPISEIVRAYPAAAVAGAEGRVIGFPDVPPPDLAAFWNTSMIRHRDFNDALIAGHPSDMLGAIASVSRLREFSGADTLSALVVAYEIYARLATRIMATEHSVDQGYAQRIATSAALCRLLDLPRDQMRHAIAMAATSGVPLRASRVGRLSHYKGSATAVATRNAVFFVLLARAGMTGPSAPFDGRHGIGELLFGTAGPLGLEDFHDWKIRNVWFKFYPVASGLQPSVAAAVQLREHVPMDRVERIVLRVGLWSYEVSGSQPENWDPHTRESADHSQPYAFARAYQVGTVDEAAYQPDAFRDPTTLAFMRRIEVEPDHSLGPARNNIIGTTAEVIDVDGRAITAVVRHPRGHTENPMTTDEINQKARSLIGPTLGPVTERAIDAAWGIARAPSLTAVLDRFVPEPGTPA
jgi:2-methylcitrate dehydratase